MPYVRYDVGEGTRVSFWSDRWCGELPLKDMFPELYRCMEDKDVLVSSILVRNLSRDGCSWDVRFLRDFHDWELVSITSFMDFIYSHLPMGAGSDNWSWEFAGK